MLTSEVSVMPQSTHSQDYDDTPSDASVSAAVVHPEKTSKLLKKKPVRVIDEKEAA